MLAYYKYEPCSGAPAQNETDGFMARVPISAGHSPVCGRSYRCRVRAGDIRHVGDLAKHPAFLGLGITGLSVNFQRQLLKEQDQASASEFISTAAAVETG